jgi:tetratricopeptide (TPR) repeat protein
VGIATQSAVGSPGAHSSPDLGPADPGMYPGQCPGEFPSAHRSQSDHADAGYRSFFTGPKRDAPAAGRIAAGTGVYWLLFFVLPLGLAGAFWLARPYRAACIEQTAFRHLSQLQAAGLSGGNIPGDRLVADLERAVSLDPGNAHLFQMLGATHLFRNELDKALAALSNSIKLRKDPEVLLNYGLALAAAGRKAEARTSFQQGLLFLPDHPQLKAALAWIDRLP